MGVPALAGRFYEPGDLAAGAEPVVVLGYKFWQRQFQGDTSAIGRLMMLDGTSRRIVGIMPPRFMFRGADVYIPLDMRRDAAALGLRYVHVLGRLKSGYTREQAAASLQPVLQDLARRFPAGFPSGWKGELRSFKEIFPSSIRQQLWLLFGAVGLLLLIACANVSNILLARGAARRREMAVRSALGAERVRLVRQLLTESLILALAGGVAGCLLAWGGLRWILAVLPPDTIPDESEVVLSLPVLAFSIAVCLITTLIFGLAPALATASRDLATPLREASRGSGGGRQAWLRGSLVVSEVALSVVLLVSAALVVKALFELQNLDVGFRAEHVLSMRVPLSDRMYPTVEKRNQFLESVLARVKEVPGIRAAAWNTWLHPLGNWGVNVEVSGQDPDKRRVTLHQVSRDYLETMRIGMIAGRVFDDREIQARRNVAMVSSAFVARYFPGQNAIGKEFRIPRVKDAPLNLGDDRFQIIGVTRLTRARYQAMEAAPEIYVPNTLGGLSDILLVRTEVGADSVAKTIAQQVYSVSAVQPVMDVRTLDRVVGDFIYAGPRFQMILFVIFAAMGLLLSAVGVYGRMAHSVMRQTSEIGLRMALGAGAGSILGMVLGRGTRLMLAGLITGLGLTWPAGRVLAKYLWRVPAFDALAAILVCGLLLAVGVIATLQPAWRASRVAPVEALRYE